MAIKLITLVSFVLCCGTSLQETVGPSVIVNPSDIVATEGSNVTLYCVVRGKPQPQIVWRKDGVLLTGRHFTNVDGKLTIVYADHARDEGVYQCLVTNTVGTVVSLKATLGFPFLDRFTEPLSSHKASAGDALVLKCDPPNARPLTMRSLRWSKRDINFPSLLPPLDKRNYYSVSKTGDLYFSYVTSTDTGNYICVAGNTLLGKTEERTVKLKVDFTKQTRYDVRHPDIFEDFTEPKFAVKGQPFVLECIAKGRPVPRISLKKHGTDTELGSTSANKRTYVVRRFTEQDAGKYICKTSNDYGQTKEKTTSIHLLVEAKWIAKLEDTRADVNSTHTWQCMADGIPPISYRWFYNGNQLSSSGRYHINGGHLTLPILKTSDSGMYQCSASNDVRTLMTSASLDVKATPACFPKNSYPPRHSNAVTGGTAEILCQPAGAPKPTVTWFRGSTALSTTGRYEVTREGILRIKNVAKNDEGKYTCRATNSLGSANKDSRLWVKDGVVIVNFRKRVTCVVGRNLTLTCQADAEKGTVVSFEWKQNFLPVVEKNVVIYNDVLARTSTLVITGVTLRNSATYSCTATASGSKKSSDTAEVTVKVQGPPKAPTSISVTRVINHRVNITWVSRDTTHSSRNKVIIEYDTLYEPEVWYSARSVAMVALNRAEVKISPWAFYRFRVVLENAVGRSPPSQLSALVESPASVPDKAPSNITGEGKHPTELTISWQPLKRLDHNGPGLHYAVFYRQVKDPSPMSRIEVRTNSDEDPHSYTITETQFYEQFEFQVQAINALGPGPKSTIVYGYSGERSPVGEPKDLRVHILNSRSARATWTGIRKGREAARGKLLGYKVYYWSTEYGIRPTDAQYQPTDNTDTMLGLDSFTTYFFQVVAYNSKGDGPGSNVVGPLSTPESVPEAPFSLDIHVSNPEVTLVWKPPLRTNGMMVGYQVTVRKLPMGQMNIIDVNHERLAQVFEALDLGAKYQFALLARNRVGFGPPLVVNFDLKTVPKHPPDEVFILVDEKQQMATVKWSKVDVKVDGYRISYWNTKDGTPKSLKFREVDARSQRQLKIANLERHLSYKFQVASFQKYGDSLVLGPKSKEYTISVGKPRTGANSVGNHRRPALYLVVTLIISAALLVQS